MKYELFLNQSFSLITKDFRAFGVALESPQKPRE